MQFSVRSWVFGKMTGSGSLVARIINLELRSPIPKTLNCLNPKP